MKRTLQFTAAFCGIILLFLFSRLESAQQVITPGAAVTLAEGRDIINANFTEVFAQMQASTAATVTRTSTAGIAILSKSGTAFSLLPIVGGGGITTSTVGNVLTLTGTSTAGGDITGAQNVGTGAGVFVLENAGILQFKGLEAGTAITLSTSATGIRIDAITGGGGSGDVTGPASAANQTLAFASSTSGKAINFISGVSVNTVSKDVTLGSYLNVIETTQPGTAGVGVVGTLSPALPGRTHTTAKGRYIYRHGEANGTYPSTTSEALVDNGLYWNLAYETNGSSVIDDPAWPGGNYIQQEHIWEQPMGVPNLFTYTAGTIHASIPQYTVLTGVSNFDATFIESPHTTLKFGHAVRMASTAAGQLYGGPWKIVEVNTAASTVTIYKTITGSQPASTAMKRHIAGEINMSSMNHRFVNYKNFLDNDETTKSAGILMSGSTAIVRPNGAWGSDPALKVEFGDSVVGIRSLRSNYAAGPTDALNGLIIHSISSAGANTAIWGLYNDAGSAGLKAFSVVDATDGSNPYRMLINSAGGFKFGVFSSATTTNGLEFDFVGDANISGSGTIGGTLTVTGGFGPTIFTDTGSGAAVQGTSNNIGGAFRVSGLANLVAGTAADFWASPSTAAGTFSEFLRIRPMFSAGVPSTVSLEGHASLSGITVNFGGAVTQIFSPNGDFYTLGNLSLGAGVLYTDAAGFTMNKQLTITGALTTSGSAAINGGGITTTATTLALNAPLKLVPLASDPIGSMPGAFYYNTAQQVPYYNNGTSFIAIASTAAAALPSLAYGWNYQTTNATAQTLNDVNAWFQMGAATWTSGTYTAGISKSGQNINLANVANAGVYKVTFTGSTDVDADGVYDYAFFNGAGSVAGSVRRTTRTAADGFQNIASQALLTVGTAGDTIGIQVNSQSSTTAAHLMRDGMLMIERIAP